jgi:hypothetical protein
MKTKLIDLSIVIALTIFVSFAPSAFAVEGGFGAADLRYADRAVCWSGAT